MVEPALGDERAHHRQSEDRDRDDLIHAREHEPDADQTGGEEQTDQTRLFLVLVRLCLTPFLPVDEAEEQGGQDRVEARGAQPSASKAMGFGGTTVEIACL